MDTTTFVSAVNCMDGRVQLPLIEYMKEHFNAQYVDMITEPGPVALFENKTEGPAIISIKKRLDISVYKHNSSVIAVAAHADCAGNPKDEDTQKNETRIAVKTISAWYPDAHVIGLWINNEWKVETID